MKKLFLVTVMMMVVALANTVSAQSLDDILSKHFKAVGQDKLMEAKSMHVKAMVNQAGTDFPMEMKIKRPGKFFVSLDMQGMKMIQVFNGEKGWMVAPWISAEPQEMTGDVLKQAKQQAEIVSEGELFNYKKKGSTADLVGKVSLDGKDAYRIKLTTKDGIAKDYFIDANTFLIAKLAAELSSGGQTVSLEQTMKEYKTIDGITLATKIEQKSPTGNAIINMEDVKFNENFDDSVFEKPSN